MTAKLHILVVDDMKSIVGEVRKYLSLLSIESDIDFRCPDDPNIRFGCDLPQGTDLDRYDLALVDLELFPTKSSIYYEPDDLRGGTEVLPYLRQQAPWLPVLAESRLYLNEAEHFLPVAGSFGFDGHLPRDIFRKGTVDKKLWESLLKTAFDLRKKAVIGEGVWSRKEQPEIEADNEVQSTLGRRSEHWRDLIQYMFCFSRKVILHQLRGGFSGADVFKAYTRPPFEQGGAEGEWLLKVSNSPSKLHRESEAHQSMLRGGLDFARMVPLLWNGVIVDHQTAAIAYQFARGTQEAIEVLSQAADPIPVFTRLNSMFKRFYRSPRLERSIISNLVNDWGPNAEVLNKCWPLIPKSQIKEFLRQAVSDQSVGILAEDVEYRRCLIHGDLHLGNVMIGDSDVLIDFARSADGPIAVDAAKLIADSLLRLPLLRASELPIWDSATGVVGEILTRIQDSFDLNEGDKKLFSVFLNLNLAAALLYEDVAKDSKAWIRSVLSKSKL